MKPDTARRHLERFLSRMRDCVSEHFSHEQCLNNMRRLIYETPEWKRVPGWVQAEVFARYDERTQCAHRYGALRWAYEWNGKLYSGWRSLPEDLKQAIREDKVKGHHYWTKTGVLFS